MRWRVPKTEPTEPFCIFYQVAWSYTFMPHTTRLISLFCMVTPDTRGWVASYSRTFLGQISPRSFWLFHLWQHVWPFEHHSGPTYYISFSLNEWLIIYTFVYNHITANESHGPNINARGTWTWRKIREYLGSSVSIANSKFHLTSQWKI